MIGRQNRDQGQLFHEYKLDDVIPKDRPAVQETVRNSIMLDRAKRKVRMAQF